MIINNSDKLLNFKETIPKSPGSLPIMPFVNPKTVFLNWLEYKFNSLNLKAPVVLSGEYPSEVLLREITTDEDGEILVPNPRGVSVVFLDGAVGHKAIGEVLKGEPITNESGEEVGIKYGWIENIQMEFTYWSVSSRDRDFGGELLRSYIFEGHRTGYLMENGIMSLDLKNHYDTADNRLASQNKYIQYSVSVFNVKRYFWGTLNYADMDLPTIEGVEIEFENGPTDSPILNPTDPTINPTQTRAYANIEEKEYSEFLYEKSYVICGGGGSVITPAKSTSISAKEYGVCID